MMEKIKQEEKKQKEKKQVNEVLASAERYRNRELIIYDTLDSFKSKILDFFDLKEPLLEKYKIDYIDQLKDYELKHPKFQAVLDLLYDIEPTLKLAYELSQDHEIQTALKKEELKEDTVVKLVKNFLNLNRTGRKKKLGEYDLETFQKFKEENSQIFSFLRKYKFNIKLLSNYELKKSDFERFLQEYNWRFRDDLENAGRSTLYRYDKDMYFLRENIYKIKDVIESLERKRFRDYGMKMFKEGLYSE